MSNEEILEKRWTKTDKTLKEFLPKIKKLGKKAVDDIKEMFDSLDITYLDLNKPISKSEKSKLDRKIEEWEENGLIKGYFLFLITSKKKYTYADMLEILIYGLYAEQNERIKKYSKQIFTTTANDIYNQALEEKKEKPKKDFSLTWEMIYSLLWLPTYNKHWEEYLELLALTNEQEMYKEVLNNIGQNKKLNINVLNTLTTKQTNRILCINDDKYSGALNDVTRSLGNKVYLEPFKAQKDLQVRFIAEVDKRSTEMCLSMDNKLFYVNDWNKFYRYSDMDKKEVLYTVFGLEQGANLPPINNHFHWCRSTITYMIDEPRETLNKKIQTYNEKLAINKWLSSDFYSINQKMYNDQKLTEDEKKLVKDLYRGLNKQPYYNAKDNEYIVRVLEVDDSTIENIISTHQINKIYQSKAFESYSLKDGYNPNANVFFYVKGSKKARNLLEYNPMEREAEVLYQYGTEFITQDYYTNNGKHYFLMEEYDGR